MSTSSVDAWIGSLDATAVRRWGVQGATSILDQGVFSGANFLVQILLARWFSPEEYGAFAVSFVVVLFLSGFHNAFILEPMSVLGPADHQADLRAYLEAHLRLHVVLTGAIGALLALGALAAGPLGWLRPPLAPALLGAGAALPFMLWIWLARRVAYVTRRPRVALQGSLVYAGLLLALLGGAWAGGWLLGSLVVPYAILAVASLLAGILTLTLALRPLPHPPSASGRPLPKLIRENWDYGKWIAGSGVLYSTAGQIQTLALAFFGLAEAGALRAMQNFMLPMAQAITSISQLALPAVAADFGEGRHSTMHSKGRLVSLVLTALALGYGLLLLVLQKPLELLAYGGKFADYTRLIPLLGLVPILSAVATGYGLVLRAVRWPQHALYVTGASGLTGLVSAVVLTLEFGTWGAALSIVLSYAVAAVFTLYLYRRRFAAP
jgi:O-antigen/teichoic acid export membrane protein